MSDLIITERWDKRYGRRRAIICANTPRGISWMTNNWDVMPDDGNCIFIDLEHLEDIVELIKEAELTFDI